MTWTVRIPGADIGIFRTEADAEHARKFRCGGKGKVVRIDHPAPKLVRTCPECLGTGEVLVRAAVRRNQDPQTVGTVPMDCSDCDDGVQTLDDPDWQDYIDFDGWKMAVCDME